MPPLPFKAIAFDIDDTLTKSKQALDGEMAQLLAELSLRIPVAIISGAKLEQIETQLIAYIQGGKQSNFYLFPNGGASAYTHSVDGDIISLYEHTISPDEAERIISVSQEILSASKINEGMTLYGEVIEVRGASIALSLLGQKAPPEVKKMFDQDGAKRKGVLPLLEEKLPGFSCRIGGGTTIDINRKGIDKAYGMREFAKFIEVSEEDIMYVGDALYEGGNDYAVLSTNLQTHKVSNPEDTKEYLHSILHA